MNNLRVNCCGPYDTDIQFTKFSALESLIQNQTDRTHYYDYPSADLAYRKIMKIFWILTEKKIEPLETMRKTFTTYDDQFSFIGNVFEANHWGETNVEQKKWELAIKDRRSFEIKRSDVHESGINMNIYSASIFILSSINKMDALRFKNNTDEILTVEKVVYNQSIIQGRPNAYYVAMCFKPVRKAGKLTPMYTSVILFSYIKETIEDFIRRVIGDNYII